MRTSPHFLLLRGRFPAAIIFTLVLSTAASAQARGTVAVPYAPAGAAGNGYDQASVGVEYALMSCSGMLTIAIQRLRGSARVGNGYWVDGSRVTVPAGVTPPDPIQIPFSGDIIRNGRVIGSFSNAAQDARGMGCYSGDTRTITSLAEFVGTDPSPAELNGFLHTLSVRVSPASAPLQNGAFENRVRAERREAERAAQAAERDRQAAAERAERERQAEAARQAQQNAQPQQQAGAQAGSAGTPASTGGVAGTSYARSADGAFFVRDASGQYHPISQAQYDAGRASEAEALRLQTQQQQQQQQAAAQVRYDQEVAERRAREEAEQARADAFIAGVAEVAGMIGAANRQREEEARRVQGNRYRAARIDAEAGDANAQNQLGLMYRHGRGVMRNNAEAVRWYQRAIAQGHADAHANLSFMHRHGHGVREDLGEAMKLALKARDAGSAVGAFYVGWHFEHGRGVPKNLPSALEAYRLAQTRGHSLGRESARRVAREIRESSAASILRGVYTGVVVGRHSEEATAASGGTVIADEGWNIGLRLGLPVFGPLMVYGEGSVGNELFLGEGGLRAYILTSRSPYRPYAQAAYGWYVREVEDPAKVGSTGWRWITHRGPGFTYGGGVEWHFEPGASIDFGLNVTVADLEREDDGFPVRRTLIRPTIGAAVRWF